MKKMTYAKVASRVKRAMGYDNRSFKKSILAQSMGTAAPTPAHSIMPKKANGKKKK